MKLNTFLATAGLLSAATVQADSNSTCHDYVLLSFRGTGEAQGPSVGFISMIRQILKAVPNGIEYDVVYPAAKDQDFEPGSADADRYIEAGLQSCPDQLYAMLGYSQGASAVMGALENYTDSSSPFYDALKSIVVIGNPYHVPDQKADIDQFGGSTTSNYTGALYNASLPSSEGIPKLYYNDGKLLDICYQADIVCAPAYPNASYIGHYGYVGDEQVQTIGAKHIIASLQNATATNSSSSPTALPTAGAANLRVSSALFAAVLGLVAVMVL